MQEDYAETRFMYPTSVCDLVTLGITNTTAPKHGINRAVKAGSTPHLDAEMDWRMRKFSPWPASFTPLQKNVQKAFEKPRFGRSFVCWHKVLIASVSEVLFT
jgi:hypothetical protein